jgi:hypothetical protein
LILYTTFILISIQNYNFLNSIFLSFSYILLLEVFMKNQKSILKFQIISTIFVIILGTLLHFTYEWSGENKIVGLFTENEFDVNGDPYAVQCFMGISNIIGYDLIKANQMLKLKNRVAIGLVDGDDPICIEKETGYVYLLLLETGDGEEIKIAESVEAFINKIKF